MTAAPDYADSRHLRHVLLDKGYTLRTWDTNRTDSHGKSLLGYELSDGGGQVIFGGEDFRCSPVVALDSDDCLRSLLGFLTLRPGDTDADYFADYTADQMAFAESDAESLSLYTLEPDSCDCELAKEEEDPDYEHNEECNWLRSYIPFTNLDGRTEE
jgi:hypothetical protein